MKDLHYFRKLHLLSYSTELPLYQAAQTLASFFAEAAFCLKSQALTSCGSSETAPSVDSQHFSGVLMLLPWAPAAVVWPFSRNSSIPPGADQTHWTQTAQKVTGFTGHLPRAVEMVNNEGEGSFC